MSRHEHFPLLDGMRGVAAIFVVFFHSANLYLLPVSDHIQLAVDFFYCLSGFVIAHVYDTRFRDGMTARQFITQRIIRLHPLVILSIAIGFTVTAIGAATNNGLFAGHEYALEDISIAAIMSIFLLPAGMFLGKLYYFINSPLWSLFFEYAANLVYAVTKGRPIRPAVAVVVAFCLFVILLTLAVAHSGITHLGLGSVPSFLGAFARVAFPFFIGVMARQQAVHSHVSQMSDLLLIAALCTLLTYACLQFVWQFDIAAVSLILPALVCLGSRAKVQPRLLPLWRHLGDISYPLYVLHMPIIKAVNHVAMVVLHDAVPSLVMLPLGLGLSIGAAELAWCLYDRPIRAWLNTVKTKTLQTASPPVALPAQTG